MGEIDRIAPTRRPAGRPAGHQRWEELLFVHWEVDADRLRSLVPASMELDLLDGRALVGVVPFLMRDIRSWWMPRPTALDFLETNLRTYVVVNGEPGVYFFSLEASSWLAVTVARLQWGLPYFHATMRRDRTGDEVDYETTRRDPSGARLRARYRVGEALPASAPGTAEHFLLERYLLFTERGGVVSRGQVHHVPYPAHRVELVSLEESLVGAAGLARTTEAPLFAHYSPGVDVEVFAPTRVPA